MKIGVLGCAGRMGRTVIKEILGTEGVSLSGGIEYKGSTYLGKDMGSLVGEEALGVSVHDDLESFVSDSDAIIDFTTPSSTLECAEIAARLKKIHIIGTTGMTGEQISKLEAIAAETTMVFAANMSVGVNLLIGLVEKVSSLLDNDFDIEVLEMHHRNKVDAPSGTALALGKAAAEGRNVALPDVARKSREGEIGARPKGEIGFATLRGGDVVGDHTVIFAGEGERIELTHKASDRKIFAAGAIRAAKWAKKKKPGLYSIKDVLGI